MLDTNSNTNVFESILKGDITIHVDGESYTLRIPSIKDRLMILEKTSNMCKDNGGVVIDDLHLFQLSKQIATFLILLKSTSASWVYTTDSQGNMVIDLDTWPLNCPVVRVVEEFEKELNFADASTLDTNDPILSTLWRVSRILNGRSPFSEEILGLNPIQISFIFRMYAKDHPDEVKLTDPSIARGEHPVQVWVENSDKLMGRAKDEYDRSPAKYLKKYYGYTSR